MEVYADARIAAGTPRNWFYPWSEHAKFKYSREIASARNMFKDVVPSGGRSTTMPASFSGYTFPGRSTPADLEMSLLLITQTAMLAKRLICKALDRSTADLRSKLTLRPDLRSLLVRLNARACEEFFSVRDLALAY